MADGSPQFVRLSPSERDDLSPMAGNGQYIESITQEGVEAILAVYEPETILFYNEKAPGANIYPLMIAFKPADEQNPIRFGSLFRIHLRTSVTI